MKKCTSCGKLKQETEFHWRNKLLRKRHGYCRSCQAKKHRKWYEDEDNAKKVKERTKERNARIRDEARRYTYEYLRNHPCSSCGERNPAALDFHHRNPKKKKKEIAGNPNNLICILDLRSSVGMQAELFLKTVSSCLDDGLDNRCNNNPDSNYKHENRNISQLH